MRTLLENAEAQVHLDARRQGVRLPAKLRSSGNVRLDYGYGLVPPIHDLTVDDEGIHATLSFGNAPFATFVPWSAVFLIADFAGRGAVWREDLPAELADQAELEAAPPEEARHNTESDLAPAARRFTVLDGASDDAPAAPQAAAQAETTAEGGDDEPPSPRPRPALRLVK